MRVRLWRSPYNGGWIWFSRRNLRRFSAGWIGNDRKLWWALLGFSGSITIQTSPLRKQNKQ